MQRGTVNDPANKTGYEVDVVVFGLTDDDRQPLLAIGEVKWGEVMDMTHLERLRRIRSLLTAQGRPGAETAKLACCSGAGFTGDLRKAADEDPEILLICPKELYERVQSSQ